MPRYTRKSEHGNETKKRWNGNKKSTRKTTSKIEKQTKFEDEYDPPFALGHYWQPKEYYKLKLEHPFLPGQIDSFQFPIIENETKMCDRAIYAQQLIDLMQTGNFNNESSVLAYYTVNRTTKGISRSDWDDIVNERLEEEEISRDDVGNKERDTRTHEHFIEDLTKWVKFHESREELDLLLSQQAYMQRLQKPKHLSPTDYKQQFLKLNLLIPVIPGPNSEAFDNAHLRFLFLYAMPKTWRKRYFEVGRVVSEDTIDKMAQFFDRYFKEEGTRTNTNNAQNSQGNNSNNNKNNNNGTRKSPGGKVGPEDECPLHGGHKWKDCYDNKRGDKYKPPRNSSGHNHRNNNEHHNNETMEERSNSGSSRGSRNSEQNNDNPYDDNYMNYESRAAPMTELVPKVQVKLHQGNQAEVTLNNCLLDSGGTRSCIKRSAIPSDMKIESLSTPYRAMTNNGIATHNHVLRINKLSLSDLNAKRWLENIDFIVMDNNEQCAYDVILGRDILETFGIDVRFSTHTVEWDDATIPFRPRIAEKKDIPKQETIHDITNTLSQDPVEDIDDFMDLPDLEEKPVLFGDDDDEDEHYEEDSQHMEEDYNQELKESDYDTQTSSSDVAKLQDHLSESEQDLLSKLLNEFQTMFNRILGTYPHEEVELELKPDAKPILCKPFSVPNKLLPFLRNEVKKMCQLSILRPRLTSKWAFPTFLIPKKDGTARFVSDFRRLNEILEDYTHDLPLIRDVLTRRSGYDYVTILDITSQFYHFLLSKAAQELCTITTPFGRYSYNRLPMGVKLAPSFAQAVMVRIFHDMTTVECFMDDIAIFTKGTFEEHLKDIREVLRRLDENNFSIKPKKCHFAIKEVEYLGHKITPEGIKPQPKKVDAILKLKPPTTPKLLRSFVGMVNYYRDHIRARAHTLSPLTSQTKNKKKIEWTPACQAAFDNVKS